MLSASLHFSIILARPKSSGNMGAVARVMKNTGLTDLRIVTPLGDINEEAYAYAVRGRDILRQAAVYGSIKEAVCDMNLVIATTSRKRRHYKADLDLAGLIRFLETLPETTRVALVFGNETHGLRNRELSFFDYAVAIPAASEYPSFNLAQAVGLVCYELFRHKSEENETGADSSPKVFPLESEFNEMMGHLERALLQIGFLDRQNPYIVLHRIRNLLKRNGLLAEELQIVRGLARQVEWASQFIPKADPPSD